MTELMVSTATTDWRLSDLSPAQQRLVDVMRGLRFGRIERLHVRAGDPVLEPPPTIVRQRKLAVEQPRVEPAGDFSLKQEVVALMRLFDDMNEGVVENLLVKHGLPFSVDIEERMA
jgi:hypothetical protein